MLVYNLKILCIYKMVCQESKQDPQCKIFFCYLMKMKRFIFIKMKHLSILIRITGFN